MKKWTFKVKVPVTKDITIQQWGDYIRESIRGWKGGFPPEDPMFHVASELITVKREVRNENRR